MIKCGAVVVSYNSEQTLEWCLAPLLNSDCHVVVVDSGSSDIDYLKQFVGLPNVTVILKHNIGFCCANNVGISALADCDCILLLNPDARIEKPCLDSAIALLQKNGNEKVGAVTVPLLRYDWANQKSAGVYDSLGITMRWYGRWVDHGMGDPLESESLESCAEIEAACGALMLLKRAAIEDCALNGVVGFDPSFVMYKEDIELSLRLRRAGWKIVLAGNQSAYHCRGWHPARKRAPRWARELSARNDVVVAYRYRPGILPFAIIKWIWVRSVERVLYIASGSQMGPFGCT